VPHGDYHSDHWRLGGMVLPQTAEFLQRWRSEFGKFKLLAAKTHSSETWPTGSKSYGESLVSEEKKPVDSWGMLKYFSHFGLSKNTLPVAELKGFS